MEKRKRILHLMPDDKFIDFFICQSEQVAPGISEYWLIINKNVGELKFVTSSLVKKVDWESIPVEKLVDEATAFERVVLHGFSTSTIKEFIRRLPALIDVIWLFWGGDGYRYFVDQRKWIMPKTWKLRNEILTKEAGLIKASYMRVKDFVVNLKLSYETSQIIKRVSTCCTWVEYDYEMLRHLNPKMRLLPYSYFTYEQLGFDKLTSCPLNLKSIWLGNSATYTNNHLEALHYLKEINWDGEIVVPLSYGNPGYKEVILKQGSLLFGNKFIGITEFLSLDKYHELMNQSGIVWMNHVRQQAAGNLLTALHLGKVIIMNEENNLAKTFLKWGVKIAMKEDIARLGDLDISIFDLNRQIIAAQLTRGINKKAINAMYA